jgi:hypothetical protein
MNLAKVLVDEIKKNIKPSYFNTSKTEIYVRCPYCGDSVKNKKSAHFYIELKSPFRYYCQRCSTSGILRPNNLKDLKLYSNDLAVEVHKENKNSKYSKNDGKGGYVRKTNNLIIPQMTDSQTQISKLNYVEERLGISIHPLDATEKFRIITSFKDFIVANKILEYSVSEEMLRKLNKYGVGFLSYDKSHIVFRSVVDEEISGFRYFNYNIYGFIEDQKKFYSIGKDIDILAPRIKLVLTEGIFDILGVYHHVYGAEDPENTVFISTNGKGHNLIISHMARLGFIDMDPEIYSDDDLGLEFYKNLKSYNILARDLRMKIIYNRLGKDFGVPKEKIKTKHTII